MSATLDTSAFVSRMARFTDKLGIESSVVVKKESGELMKTLVKVTPPDDVDRTRGKIDKTVRSKFANASNQQKTYFKHRLAGSGDITWYTWTSKFLYGVKQGMDKRDASADEIYKLALTLTPGGRQSLPFAHPRKKQRALISQTILATKEQVDGAVKRFKSHVGRLKAAWLVGWDIIAPTGGNMPPQWVMKQRQGARGRYVDGLSIKDFPQFTIGNSALGINSPEAYRLAQKALDIRSGAMLTNFRLFFKGKKELSQY